MKPQSLGLVGQPSTRRPALKAIPCRPCTVPLACRVGRQRQLLSETSPSPQQRVAHVAAAQSGTAPIPTTSDESIKFKKGFWTFVDIVAILGSVGGALAAILNLFSGTYVLFLPLVLPVVSLLSALQREGLIAEDNRRAYDTLRVSLARDSSALLADARGAIEEVRRELKGHNTTAARLGTIEARLSSLEGSILSAGRSSREAAAGLSLLPDRIQSDQRAALEGLVAAMRVELRRAAESLANNETTALARLDARLAAVEGSLSGLEVAQSEGLRRLSMSLNSALADAESTLQSSVRNEVARSMEPVRRLPQMLAAALPPALAAAEAVEASAAAAAAAGVLGPGVVSAAPPGVGAAVVPTVSPEQLQVIVGQEVEGAVGRILDFQAEAFGRLASVRPVPMDDEQWSALGRRLTRLERLVEGVPAGTEGVLLQGGQVAAAVAAAVREALAAQLAEARGEVAAAAAREAEAVRNDILAAQTVLRENLDSLAGALQPLQLGVAELQLAVAAVSEQQQRQQQQQQQSQEEVSAASSAPAEGSQKLGEGLPVAAAAAAAQPRELTRLLDGLTAVAQLLRDVDAKMDAVTAAVARLPGEVAAATAAAQPPPVAAAAPPSEAVTTAVTAAVTEAATEAAEAARRQQRELQTSVDSMREALAAVAAQVGALAASRQGAEVGGAAAPPLAEVVGPPEAAVPAPQPAATGGGGGGGGNIADVLSFEASLSVAAAAATAAAAAGPAADDGGKVPLAAAGATREEAYDMMLQLAKARRRSGSEAGVSGVSTTASSSGGGAAGVGTAGVVREDTGTAHLRIVGLPPFEEGGIGSELPPLPPSQTEAEVQIYEQAVQVVQVVQTAASASTQASPPTEAPQSQLQQQTQQPQWLTTSSYAQAQESFRPQQQPQQAVVLPYGNVAPAAAAPTDVSPEGNMPYVEGYGWQQPQQQQQQEAQSVPYVPYEGSVQAAMSATEPTAAPAVDSNRRPAAADFGPYTPSYTSPPPPPPPSPPTPPMQERPPYWAESSGGPAAGLSGRTTPPPLQQAQPQPPYGYTQSEPPPSQQQQQQPSWSGSAGSPGTVGTAMPPPPTVAAAAAPPPPDYRMRPLDGLSGNEIISEGLRLLRLGREETRKGEDYGLADTLIHCAISAFQRAAEVAPGDAKALGNLGNALLARGELKAAYLEALRSGPPPATYSEVEAQRGAEMAMTVEANALLTQAGVMFMKVLEMEGWSSRALVNWGRALVIRADLLAAAPDGGAALLPGTAGAVTGPGAGPGAAAAAAGAPSGSGSGAPAGGGVVAVVAQLYTSAINKFEGVLEGEPDMVPAKYRCALAMAGLSRCRAPGSREAVTLLADAINYLRDVIASPSPDAEALRPAAAAALQQYEAQLMVQRGATRQQQ